MYQTYANQNPLMNQFNSYTASNTGFVPFQGNQLINNNVHVMNNLNGHVQAHLHGNSNQMQSMKPNIQSVPQTSNGNRAVDVIKNMLKPVETRDSHSGFDIEKSYKDRLAAQERTRKCQDINNVTNAPYKIIIKDKIVTKPVKEVKENDLIVHKVVKGVDDNIEEFNKSLDIKKKEKKQIKQELKIEFSVDNYESHKKKFDYRQVFIRNIAYDDNDHEDNKKDYIKFYEQKQLEAEKGIKMIDETIMGLIDEGLIDKEELPTESDDINTLPVEKTPSVNIVETKHTVTTPVKSRPTRGRARKI